MSLQRKLEAVLEGASGTFGVAVKHLRTGESVEINGHRLFQTASVCKVAILATLYDEVHKGHISLKTRTTLTNTDLVPGSGVLQLMDDGLAVTIKDLATMMIIVSDNQATDKILELVTKEKVNRLTLALGLNDTHLEHSIWELLSVYAGMDPGQKSYDDLEKALETTYPESKIFDMTMKNNVSTPHDMNILLEKLANKTLVTSEASEQMLDILGNQQFGHRIPYLLPEGAKVANKTGSIGSVVNDVGVVYVADSEDAFVMSVLSIGNATNIEGERTIAQLAKTAYDHFLTLT
ncbi:serine hydrolase [Camelliibacillus cellulosilyticus]|uniref:Serine hydrolase n=1 Tax=Camelliibacillus cellulosilyticus TaxID=2174486 RepID=A0ABV9GKZ6_9BACL